jgi:hypothetical protein
VQTSVCSESSRKKQQYSSSANSSDSAISVPSGISENADSSGRNGPTGSCLGGCQTDSASTVGSFHQHVKHYAAISPDKNVSSDTVSFSDSRTSPDPSSSIMDVQEDPTKFPGTTMGTAFENERGTTFSVQSNSPPGDEDLQSKGSDFPALPAPKVRQTSNEPLDVDASFASSSGSLPERRKLSDENERSISPNTTKHVDDFTSNERLNSHSSSTTSESCASTSLSERVSLSLHQSGNVASSQGTRSRSSRSGKSYFSKSSSTNSKSARSSASSFGDDSKSSFSHSRSNTSSNGSRNFERSMGSTSKATTPSDRPQSAGDSCREGSSHAIASLSSRSGVSSSRDTHRSSSNTSSRSGNVSVATCSSRSLRSTSERSTNSTGSRIRSRSKSHRSKSCSLASTNQERSTSRRRDHRNKKEKKDMDTRIALKHLPDALYYGKSVSLLKEIDMGLKTEMRIVHATVNSREFVSLVSLAYQKMCKVRPRLTFLLSGAEWMHVHFLLLYSRLFDCELHFHKIALPREFQIGIPTEIHILEPIAAVLASIGIVEDHHSGVTYVPVAKPYRGDIDYKPHDPEDVTEFLEWTHKDGLGYDWNTSWEQVEVGRQSRKQMALEQGVNIPMAQSKIDPEKEEEKLKDWNLLAVEKWLGWDDDLWSSFKQACHVLSRIADFSPYKRDVKSGTYAWLLPKVEGDTGTTVRLPSPVLTADSWMIALMCNFCALPHHRTSTWYIESKTYADVQHLTNQFLEASLTKKTTNDAMVRTVEVLETVLED